MTSAGQPGRGPAKKVAAEAMEQIKRGDAPWQKPWKPRDGGFGRMIEHRAKFEERIENGGTRWLNNPFGSAGKTTPRKSLANSSNKSRRAWHRGRSRGSRGSRVSPENLSTGKTLHAAATAST